MNRTDFIAVSVIFAFVIALLVASAGRKPTPPKPLSVYSASSHVVVTSTGGVDVLTTPRYQDVPALNRPLMLPLDCYSDNGCSK